jgi:GxxExxY protein
MDKMLYQDQTFKIRGAVFDVYKKLKNFQKEKVYQDALCIGLKKSGFRVEKEKRINIYYEDQKVGTYIPDIVVEGIILIEIKAKIMLTKDDIAQFWHYLRNSDYKLGLLINFGSPNKVQIIRRIYDTARTK